jgi:hypothetical protein
MFNFENVTNVKSIAKVVEQASSIRVFAQNKIRVSPATMRTLSLENNNILIQRDKDDLYITSMPKESKQGRPVSPKGEFSHEVLSTLLKGVHSEWNLAETGVEHLGNTYYKLELVVDGASIKEDINNTIVEEPSAHTSVTEDVVFNEDSANEDNIQPFHVDFDTNN